MSNQEVKVIVAHKEGPTEIVTRPGYVELHDETSTQFKTSDIKSFVKFCEGLEKEGNIVYNENSAVLHSDDCGINTIPYAVLSLSLSYWVESLSKLLKTEYSRDQLEPLLKQNLKFLDEPGKRFFDSILNLDLKSVTNVKRSFGKNGSYEYAISRDSSGTMNLQTLVPFTFSIPVFANVFTDSNIRKFTVEPNFDYCETPDHKLLCKFTFENHQFKEELMQAQIAIIQDEFKALEEKGFSLYYGEILKNVADDSWKYVTCDSFGKNIHGQGRSESSLTRKYGVS